jgi:hypothetical protein
MFSFAFQLSLRHFLFLKTQTPTQTEKYVLFGGSKLIPGKSATTFKYVLFSVKQLILCKKVLVYRAIAFVVRKTFLRTCQPFCLERMHQICIFCNKIT